MTTIHMAVASAAVALGVFVPAPSGHLAPIPPTMRGCTEDMACWNCATMGNRLCGVPPAMRAQITATFTDPDDQGPRDWTGCTVTYGDGRSTVRCPDGWTLVWS